MPEGPEIRLEADQIQDTLGDGLITEIYFKFEHLKVGERILKGARLLFVQTVGKGFILHFDCGFSIYGHNQLYGKWKFVNTIPQTNRELRLLLRTNGKFALLYSASDIRFLPTEDVPEIPFVKNNSGLDILNLKPELHQIYEHITQKKFINRSLSGLLLDQKFILGMGNYLRSEVLFLANVHPDVKLNELSSEHIKKLADCVKTVMVQAYEHKGVTNDLERVEEMKRKKFLFEDYRFWVFDRENSFCYLCGSKIIRVEKNSRRLYFCPKCQKRK